MCLNPKIITVTNKTTGEVFRDISVGCGKCVECCLRYSNEWASRCQDEASLYNKNCVVTLTYASEPAGGVQKADFQKFVHDLRQTISPLTVRYFGCGEYGSKFGRPHYHICLFGWCPDDCFFWKYSKLGTPLFRSPTLERLWKNGFSVVDKSMSFEALKYSAKYMQKVLPTPEGLTPAFVLMSKKPGIGFGAISKDWLVTGNRFVGGSYRALPRYYVRVLERDGYSVDTAKRFAVNSAKFYDMCHQPLSERRKKIRNFLQKKC